MTITSTLSSLLPTTLTKKMFVSTSTNLPQEADFPSTLAEMGYHVNSLSQIVQVSNGKFHPFFPSNSERYNQREREAMHALARGVVKGRLAEHGVEELWCFGDEGEKVKRGVRPVQQNIRILATKKDLLREKRDVILVIGEHSEDPGVWAYRHLMNDGGIDGGSAVGLIKKLEERGIEVSEENESGSGPQGGSAPKEPTTTREAVGLGPATSLKSPDEDPLCLPETADGFHIADLSIEDGQELEARAGETTAHRTDSMVSVSTNQVPGIIIFNPGQRLYSPTLNDCMTQTTWNARPKYRGIGDNYKINNLRNHVPGHFTKTEHVETMFERIIPQLVREDVRFWVVAIADGAETFINYMDAKLVADHKAKIGSQIMAMAFMEPTHVPDQLKSLPFKLKMRTFAKSWIKSSKPLGTWRNKDGALDPIMSESQLSLPEDKAKVRKGMELLGMKSSGGGDGENQPPGGQSTVAGPSGTNTKAPVVATRAGNEAAINEPLSTYFGHEDPLALPDEIRDAPYKLPKSMVPGLLRAGFPPQALEYNKPPSYTTTSPEDEGDVRGAGGRGLSDSSSHSLSPYEQQSPRFSALGSSGSEISHPAGREDEGVSASPPQQSTTPEWVQSLPTIGAATSSSEGRAHATVSPEIPPTGVSSPSIGGGAAHDSGPTTQSPSQSPPLSALASEHEHEHEHHSTAAEAYGGDDDADNESTAESIDYENTPVSCHTYSGGTDVTEMIWPNVVDEVLDWFKWVAEGRLGGVEGA